MQIQPDASNPPTTPGVAGQRQQVTPMEGVDSTPAATSDSTIAACGSGDSTIIVEPTAALKRQFESTSFQDSGGPSAKRQRSESDFQSFVCSGVTVASIKANAQIPEKEKVLKGFNHLVGEGICARGNAISNQLPWDYSAPVCGMIHDKKSQRPLYAVHEYEPNLFSIHSVGCTGNSAAEGKSCEGCKLKMSALYRKCRDAVDLRSSEPKGKMPNAYLASSPGMLLGKIKAQNKTLKSVRAKFYHLAKKQRKKGVRLPDGLADDLFDADTEKLAIEYFEKKKVSEDDISRILFFESLKNAHIAQKSGSKRVRHLPLMIRFVYHLTKN
jgi:hypothetical protein